MVKRATMHHGEASKLWSRLSLSFVLCLLSQVQARGPPSAFPPDAVTIPPTPPMRNRRPMGLVELQGPLSRSSVQPRARPLPPIEPPRSIPSNRRQTARPSLAATNDVQQQFNGPPPPEFGGLEAPTVPTNIMSPGEFSDSPASEGRNLQNSPGMPPSFGPRETQQQPSPSESNDKEDSDASGINPPFAAEDGLFSSDNLQPTEQSRGSILPVRPSAQSAIDREESIPQPPEYDGETESSGNSENEGRQQPQSRNGDNANPNNQRQTRPEQTSSRFNTNSRRLPPLESGNVNENQPEQNAGPPGVGRPILPVRPTNIQEKTGENWNISDAQAAGLINGNDLDASQEGRCVTCGPRNGFESVSPENAQTAIPKRRPDDKEDPMKSFGREKTVSSYARPFGPKSKIKMNVPDGFTEPPSELFPSPERLKFGEISELNRQAILQTCLTKLDCKIEPFGSRQKRNDIHRSEFEVQRRYAPYESERSIAKRLDKVHMVKLLMLNAAGLADHVTATNDGTIEQDILLTDDQAEYLLHKLHVSRRNKRSAIYMEQMPAQHWDSNQPIPYTFDLSLNPRDQHIIKLALRSIEISTCIRFQYFPTKPAGNHIVYLKIATPTFCGLSYIGKISPANPIYLSFACGDPIGVVIHETLHALGVNHEHLRIDRDKYISMNWDNINPQYFDYFAVSDPLSYTSYGVPFDFESIMMYGPYTGAVDPNRPSIQPKDDDGTKFAKMGQRKRLSKTDIQLLDKMYCKPPDCVDRNVFCGTWSLRDLCFNAPQSAWMQKHCRRSCNLC
ncbi:Metalloendopeptidase [Aphelenchoides besseyi]|nr:Metalloendopeptidase [Aphelenchoides besseyi]